MKVCAVIVTYGDRFHLLKQVIEACFREGVDKVIVVDNASIENSRKLLKEFEIKNKDKLQVIYLDKNTGSAGGYKRGLKEAYYNNDCDYLLTLDDDNVIEQGSLEKLQNVLNYLNKYQDYIMLAMYRPLRSQDRNAIENGIVKCYKTNNFMGFNFLSFVKKNITKKVFQVNKERSKVNLYPILPVETNAMGRLFFSRTIIETIGYPNSDFFLYAEDHEYTYRFTKLGGKIFLCSEAEIYDIDQTTRNNNNENIGYFDKEFSEIKMYYSVRNHTYLSKTFIKNKYSFYGNLGVVSLLHLRNIFKIPLPLFLRRYKLYFKAIKDGLNGKLGKTF